MANNIKGGAPNAVVASETVSFATAGITSVNTEIIYLVDNPLKSYVPGRAINGISGFEEGKGYYFIAKVDMDLEAYLIPPIPSGGTQLATPGSFNAAVVSSTAIDLTWNSVVNATSYTLQRATNSSFTTGLTTIFTGNATSFDDTGLTPSTQYYYRIKATAVGFTDSAYATDDATTSAGSSFDSDAQAFMTAAGITNSTQQDAIDDLVVALKAASIWTKMKAIYPFVGGTAATHKFNLKDPADTDAAFRLTFFGSWTHSATGAKGAGGSTGADTHFVPGTHYDDGNAHYSLYLRDNVSAGNQYELGLAESGGTGFYFNARTASDTVNTYRMHGVSDTLTPANTDSRGFFLVNLDSALRVYKNGTELANDASLTTVAERTISIYIGAYNFSGSTPAEGSTRQLAFCSIGQALTPTEVTAFNTAVAAYQTALSRNV
jgi:hypothetical protein